MSRAVTVWFTGLPASGKTTLAEGVREAIATAGDAAYILDGDILRTGLTSDLGFSREDRAESVRRAGEAALLLNDAGVTALVSLVSPYREHRGLVRSRHAEAGLSYLEVHMATPLEVCEARDPKGLYARARSGALRGLTGIDDPYEAPLAPDVVCGLGELRDDVEAVLAEIASARQRLPS